MFRNTLQPFKNPSLIIDYRIISTFMDSNLKPCGRNCGPNKPNHNWTALELVVDDHMVSFAKLFCQSHLTVVHIWWVHSLHIFCASRFYVRLVEKINYLLKYPDWNVPTKYGYCQLLPISDFTELLVCSSVGHVNLIKHWIKLRPYNNIYYYSLFKSSKKKWSKKIATNNFRTRANHHLQIWNHWVRWNLSKW